MAIKACIFDLDGVLVYVNKFHYIAWKKIADELNVEFNTELHKEFRGLHRESCLEKLLSWNNLQLSEEETNRLLEKKSRHFSNGLGTLGPDKVLPGVLDFLKLLKKEEIKIGLSSVGYNAKKVLLQIGLTHYFNHIVDGKSYSYSNLDTQIFLENANQFGLEPEECLVFEDSQEGVKTAKEAGMKVIGVGLSEDLQEADKTILSFETIKTDWFSEI